MTEMAKPAVIVNVRPIFLSERMFHKVYNLKCSVGKKYWSWFSRDLAPKWTGGKPPVVK
jgi:hypothetical protein